MEVLMDSKTQKLKETRLLLNLYPVNSLRLGRIEARLKVEGKTRTWWINAAIREKLDRDHLETNKPEGEYVPVPLTLDTPRGRRMYEKLNRLLAAFQPVAPLAGFGVIPQEEVTREEVQVNGRLHKKWVSLSAEEQWSLIEATENLADMEAKGVAVQAPDPWPAPPKGEKPDIWTDEEPDFWSDEDVASVRANVRKHCQ
jgi:hypothetical protein